MPLRFTIKNSPNLHKKTTNWGMLVVVVKWHHHASDLVIVILVLIFLRRGGKGAVGLTLCEAPTCETRPDHYTGTSVPYSLRQLCGFFNVPCWQYDTEDAGDRAYNLSPISKKTRTSPAWQSGTLPTELTSREMTWHHIAYENIRFSSLFAAGDVSRGGMSATQRQKFHTDDVQYVQNPVRSADWSTE